MTAGACEVRAVLTEDPDVFVAVARAVEIVSDLWSEIIPPEDLTNDVWAKLLEVVKRDRLRNDLGRYGWPKNGLPDNVPGVVFLAAKAWAHGLCSAAKQPRDGALVTRAGERASGDGSYYAETMYDRNAVKALFRELGPDLDGEYDLPYWVVALRRQIPELTPGQREIIRKFAVGEKHDASNRNKAIDQLIVLTHRAEAPLVRDFDGPGSAPRRSRRDSYESDGHQHVRPRRTATLSRPTPASDAEMIERYDAWAGKHPDAEGDYALFVRRWTRPIPPGPAKSLFDLQLHDVTYPYIHRA